MRSAVASPPDDERTVRQARGERNAAARRYDRKQKFRKWLESVSQLIVREEQRDRERRHRRIVALREETDVVLCPIGARTASGQQYGMVDVRDVRDDGVTDWHGMPDERRAALEAQVRRGMEGQAYSPAVYQSRLREQQAWDARVQQLLPRCVTIGTGWVRPPPREQAARFLQQLSGGAATVGLAEAQDEWAAVED